MAINASANEIAGGCNLLFTGRCNAGPFHNSKNETGVFRRRPSSNHKLTAPQGRSANSQIGEEKNIAAGL
ncbi:MAG TPA: hypothetical protein VG269_11120 [Tepidisphaeraceae bacterium]|jgi:hypothetical protein|nr:hypothetical protein [Tepidisphaeraceae bacterium]